MAFYSESHRNAISINPVHNLCETVEYCEISVSLWQDAGEACSSQVATLIVELLHSLLHKLDLRWQNVITECTTAFIARRT